MERDIYVSNTPLSLHLTIVLFRHLFAQPVGTKNKLGRYESQVQFEKYSLEKRYGPLFSFKYWVYGSGMANGPFWKEKSAFTCPNLSICTSFSLLPSLLEEKNDLGLPEGFLQE